MTSKKEIRNTIKSMGFKASIRKHTLIDNAVSIYIDELGIGTGNVYPREIYEANEELFKYISSLSKTFLDTGEKII